MLIGESPVGTRIAMGINPKDEEDIIWRKISDDNDFMSENVVARYSLDNAEFNNTSRARRNHGNNFFPHSNILQGLNGSGNQWFKAAHQYDWQPFYAHHEGFLSSFTHEELTTMVEREITVAVPLGSRKDFGKEFKMKTLVCLPSASEIGYHALEELDVEGVELPEIKEIIALDRFSNILTRTGVKDAGHVIAYFRNVPETISASDQSGVHPMIRMDANKEITDSGDIRYIKSHEQETFMENFLKMIS